MKSRASGRASTFIISAASATRRVIGPATRPMYGGWSGPRPRRGLVGRLRPGGGRRRRQLAEGVADGGRFDPAQREVPAAPRAPLAAGEMLAKVVLDAPAERVDTAHQLSVVAQTVHKWFFPTQKSRPIKMPRCKAPEILRNKAYPEGTSLTKEKGNAADGRFSSALMLMAAESLAASVRLQVAGILGVGRGVDRRHRLGDQFLVDVDKGEQAGV